MNSDAKEWVLAFSIRWMSVIEIVFTGGLVVFSCLLYFANKDYARTARLAQRPWIGESFLTDATGNRVQFGNLTIAANQPINIGVEYSNFGQSPSPSHELAYRIMLGSRAPDKVADWKDSPVPYFDCRAVVDEQVSGPLFPGDLHSHVAYEDEGDIISLSLQDFDDVKGGKKTLYLKGCIAYTDTSGLIHHTDFCMFFWHQAGTAAGRFGFCPMGNSAD